MRTRRLLLLFYALLFLACPWLLTRLQFTFDLEQFFPQGDPDYEFFENFIKDFENDDNFLLVAVERKAGVFDRTFLEQFHDLTLKADKLPYITSAMSLTKVQYPLKTPFGITAIPAVHIDDTTFYATDKARVLQDKRFVNNLISPDASALTLVLKTVNGTDLYRARAIMGGLDSLLAQYPFEATHVLGRARLQRDMVWMEAREVTVSTLIAAVLVFCVLFFIYRTWQAVLVSMTGIGLALVFFLALLSALGRELNALAALYPVLICIVGVADTIHIKSKYLDELARGHDPFSAIRITLREIGLATFITCITTALGFASLATSRTVPIQSFGVNAAIGVVTAFFVIYGWLWAVLPFFKTEQLIKFTPEYAFWERFMAWTYRFTQKKARLIIGVSIALLGLCLWGISKIHTNYYIKYNLPRGHELTSDFHFFERKFSGFRPVEIAVFAKNGYYVDDLEVLREMDKVETRLRSYAPVKTSASINDLYKSLNAMQSGNRPEAYRLPDSTGAFLRLRNLAERAPASFSEVLLSKDRQKARIAARVQDVGRDTVWMIKEDLERWWAQNTDTNKVSFRMTGTGLIVDKNSDYIRDNMLKGLIPSIAIVALLMAFLFKNARIVLIFLVPNVFPLFFAGALIGFLGIPLEAAVATIFSIVFGIATDDTIHFLSTYKICRDKGLSIEASIQTTLAETGKAMCLSSIILFFSFSVLLFSIHPPSVTVGILVSITLAGALFCDLFLAPVMLRKLKV